MKPRIKINLYFICLVIFLSVLTIKPFTCHVIYKKNLEFFLFSEIHMQFKISMCIYLVILFRNKTPTFVV